MNNTQTETRLISKFTDKEIVFMKKTQELTLELLNDKSNWFHSYKKDLKKCIEILNK